MSSYESDTTITSFDDLEILREDIEWYKRRIAYHSELLESYSLTLDRLSLELGIAEAELSGWTQEQQNQGD